MVVLTSEQHKLVKTRHRFITTFLKIVLWLLAIPVGLAVVVFILLQFPAVQTYVAEKAVNYVSRKTGAELTIKRMSISMQGAIQLEELMLRDQHRDTLLYGERLSVSLDVAALFSKQIRLTTIQLETFTAHVQRDSSGFNFDFITDAFASGKKDSLAPVETSAGWGLALKNIRLKNIYVTYLDRVSGIDLRSQLGNFKTQIDVFDLPAKQIKIGKVQLDSSHVFLEQVAVKSSDMSASAPPDFNMDVSELLLSNSQFVYNGKSEGIQLETSIGQLKLKVEAIHLPRYRFDLSELILQNSSVAYSQQMTEKTAVSDPSLQKITGPAVPWQLKLRQLTLENNSFAYNNKSAVPLNNGMDYNHLLLNNLDVSAKEVDASPAAIRFNLEHLTLDEKNGFRIGSLRSGVSYDSTHIALTYLDLDAGHSHIAGNLAISYPSLRQLGDSIHALKVDLNFKGNTIAASDVLYFAPQVFENPYLAAAKGSSVSVNGKITGSTDHLSFSDFSLQAASRTRVVLNGELQHVTAPKQLYAELSSFHISGSRADVLAFVPDTLLSGIELPETFEVKGAFTGYLKNFNTNLDLHSSSGDVTVQVKMKPSAGNIEQPYQAKLKTKSFDLGKLFKQPDLGPLTLAAEVKGSGWDTSHLQATVKVEVEKAVLKKYEYQQIALKGTLSKQSFSGTAVAKDRNLDFVFDGIINLDRRKPQYDFTLDLKGADLGALNLSKENVRISALLESNISDQDKKNVTGRAAVRNLRIIRDTKKYRLDSLVVTSELKDSAWDIRIRSELLTARLKGDITLTQVAASLRQQVNAYFDLQEQMAGKALNAQKFEFELQLFNPALLAGEMIPGLEKISPASLNGAYDSEARQLQLNASLPQVTYSGVTLDSLKVSVASDREKLAYRLNVAEVSTSSLKTENLALSGELKNNSLSFQLNTNKDDSTKLLAIGGLLKSLPGKKYEMHFNPELIFNAENWNIDPANHIGLGKGGMYAERVLISNGARSIELNSSEPQEGAPLAIRFTDFELTTVSRLLENNNDLLRGTVNGTVVLEKHNQVSAFRSDLVIGNFAFKAVPVGTIRLKADNFDHPQNYVMALNIEGNGNNINAKGSYLATGKKGSMDFNVDVSHLELATIEPFTFGQVSRLSGTVNGKLSVKGPPGLPEVNGSLYVKEGAFRPRILDSYFVIHEGQLIFDEKKIRMNQLALYDSLGNKALVNGSADIKNLPDVGFDMQVKTSNFLALNTNRKDNPLYYGRVFLDSDIKLRGSMNAPDLDVKARLNAGSSITYVKPESLVGKSESKGIVEFTDSLHRDTTIMLRLNDSIKGIGGMKGVSLDATISFDKTVELKMIVDQETGDSLYLIGGGTLDFKLDRSGKTSLAGKYRINDGGYYLSINDLVRRNFKIEKGSSVTWSGDLLDAYVDLKAIYTVKTSPIDLVQEEVSAMGELEKNKYRNLLTFNVYLKMTGFISSPEISFDIELAPGDRGALNGSINGRLAQLREDETALNKQVFALLTLRRFVSDNPLDNGNDGGGLSSASRSSASKVLTQQLNTLSDRYVNFVDLDLGVNSFEDYSSGQEQGRTQLQLGVSKQLLSDKVTVRVGGNVELEGERANQNNANDVAGNISIDYKLTNDGRYKLKAFRENQYENPIEGELTKTGMGILYTRNYNTFRELLSKPAPRINPASKRNEDDKK